jgi:hypothetical protein
MSAPHPAAMLAAIYCPTPTSASNGPPFSNSTSILAFLNMLGESRAFLSVPLEIALVRGSLGWEGPLPTR